VIENYFRVVKYIPAFLTDLFFIVLNPGRLFSPDDKRISDFNGAPALFYSLTLGAGVILLFPLFPPVHGLLQLIILSLLFLFCEFLSAVSFSFISLVVLRNEPDIKSFMRALFYFTGGSSILAMALILICLALFKTLEPAYYKNLLDFLFLKSGDMRFSYCNACGISSFVLAGGFAFIILWNKLAWEFFRQKTGHKRSIVFSFLSMCGVFAFPFAIIVFILITSVTGFA